MRATLVTLRLVLQFSPLYVLLVGLGLSGVGSSRFPPLMAYVSLAVFQVLAALMAGDTARLPGPLLTGAAAVAGAVALQVLAAAGGAAVTGWTFLLDTSFGLLLCGRAIVLARSEPTHPAILRDFVLGVGAMFVASTILAVVPSIVTGTAQTPPLLYPVLLGYGICGLGALALARRFAPDGAVPRGQATGGTSQWLVPIGMLLGTLMAGGLMLLPFAGADVDGVLGAIASNALGHAGGTAAGLHHPAQAVLNLGIDAAVSAVRAAPWLLGILAAPLVHHISLAQLRHLPLPSPAELAILRALHIHLGPHELAQLPPRLRALSHDPVRRAPSAHPVGSRHRLFFGGVPIPGSAIIALLLGLLALVALGIGLWRRHLARAVERGARIEPARQKHLHRFLGRVLRLSGGSASPGGAQTVRAVYRRFLALGSSWGHAKEPAETGLEYSAAIRERYPLDDAALARLNQLYMEHRYGEREESEHTTSEALDALLTVTRGRTYGSEGVGPGNWDQAAE